MKKKKNESADIAKRQWPRLNPSDVPYLKRVTINQGTEAHVIDISRGGVLLETDVRLLPQAKIMLKVITTEGTFTITGSVLRSSIKALGKAPTYQSAIVFENPLTLFEDLGKKEETQPNTALSDPTDMFETSALSYPNQISPDHSADTDPAVFTIIAPDGLGIYFNDSLKLNDW
jgi:hypothetical protein